METRNRVQQAMSDGNNHESLNNPEIPDYYAMDKPGRDAFLSEHGSFSEEQRQVFNNICNLYEPEIPWKKVLLYTEQEHDNARAIVLSLMKHLEAARCGLVTWVNENGSLKKDRVVLTKPGATRFWYWSAENLWQRCSQSESLPFPVLSAFRKTWPEFPPDILVPLDRDSICSGYIQSRSDQVVLFRIDDGEGDSIIVTPASLAIMLESARAKIRRYMNDSALLSLLSRILETVVSDIRVSLDKNQYRFWNKLANAILSHREDIRSKRSSIPSVFFVSALIVAAHTQKEMQEISIQRKDDADKRMSMKYLVNTVAEAPGYLVSRKDLEQQMKPMEARWPDFRELYIDLYMRQHEKGTLPHLLRLDTCIIHRDHLYAYFRSELQSMSDSLETIYKNLLVEVLKGQHMEQVFGSPDLFRKDMGRRIRQQRPLLSELLSKPGVTSESIVHFLTHVRTVSSRDKISKVLQLYFLPNSRKFKPLEQVMNLDPVELLSQAYRELGLFYRFFIRVFGRYDSYVQAFSNFRNPQHPAHRRIFHQTHGRHSRVRRPEHMTRFQNMTRGKNRINTGESTTRVYSAQAGGTTGRSRKRYTKRQENKAWEDFREAAEQKKNK